MRFLIRTIQRGAERKLRVPADYLGRLGEGGLGGLFKFLLMLPAAGHRKRLPREVVHAARVAAARHEDCGSCVQIAVNAALDDGVPPALVRAMVEGRRDTLPPPVELALRFADAVLAADGSDDDLRPEVERSFGEPGLCELALAIGTGRVFPTVKRALGFATSCALTTYDIPEG